MKKLLLILLCLPLLFSCGEENKKKVINDWNLISITSDINGNSNEEIMSTSKTTLEIKENGSFKFESSGDHQIIDYYLPFYNKKGKWTLDSDILSLQFTNGEDEGVTLECQIIEEESMDRFKLRVIDYGSGGCVLASDMKKIMGSSLYFVSYSFEQAFPSYSNANSNISGEARKYFNEGFNAYEEKDYERAIEMYTKSIDLNPNYGKAYHNRGLSFYFGFKDRISAIKDFTKSIDLGNDDNDLKNRGWMLAEEGYMEACFCDFKRMCELGDCSQIEKFKKKNFRNSEGYQYYFDSLHCDIVFKKMYNELIEDVISADEIVFEPYEESSSNLNQSNPIFPYLYKLISDYRFLSEEFVRSEELLNHKEYSNFFNNLESDSYFEMDLFMRGCGGGGDINFVIKDNYLIVFNDYEGDFESSAVKDVACFRINPDNKTFNSDYFMKFQINSQTLSNFTNELIYAFNLNICSDDYALKIFSEKNGVIKEETKVSLEFLWDFTKKEDYDMIFYSENSEVARLKWEGDKYGWSLMVK